jgi:hypothetical protein
MAPPALPGAGTTAGGCVNTISAGAQQDAWSPLAIVDPGGAALLPTVSNGFIASLTPDVTARAADPGSRPT